MFNRFKKQKGQKAKPTKQTLQEVCATQDIPHTNSTQQEWNKPFERIAPSTELRSIKPKIYCEKKKYIVGKSRIVIYLEDKYNPEVNDFIAKYYKYLSYNFRRLGCTFVYAPKELEKIANEYATPIPDVEWNAQTILDLFYCRLYEPIDSAIVLFDETRNYRCALPHQSFTTVLNGIKLDVDTEEELMAIFKAYWKQLEENYHKPATPYIVDEDRCMSKTLFTDDESAKCKDDKILFREYRSDIVAEMETMYYGGPESRSVTGELLFSEDGESDQAKREEEPREQRQRKIREAEERKMLCEQPQKSRGGYLSDLMRKKKEVADDVDTFAYDFMIEVEDKQPEPLTQEDEQLLREIQELIEKLRHTGIRQQLIEQMVRMTVKPSALQVDDDARLLLTDYNKKEVKMLPIDKVVYIFFLRHPEGVALKDMADHKKELTKLYQRVLGKEKLTSSQSKSVDYLCDPLNNSINEKLSRIRQAFRAVTHDSVANSYIIQGGRGEKRYIALDEELIELGEWGKI